ncbi:hypothetical protein IF1G_00841 [Cordyceps javanica]|uniref:Uncharacterized protein n=1 Tax=Cordyceps javanica TaxID=43265 RepID=A0A545VGZ5_9HYPO|nr:hypothetical protein IF1G_00841 [Cordyceps javanica]
MENPNMTGFFSYSLAPQRHIKTSGESPGPVPPSPQPLPIPSQPATTLFSFSGALGWAIVCRGPPPAALVSWSGQCAGAAEVVLRATRFEQASIYGLP